MRSPEVVEHYRRVFREEARYLLGLNGSNFEEAQLILESALDLALNDERDEFYK